VIEGGADDLGAAGELGVRRRVDLNLIQLPRRVRHAEAWLDAPALAPRHHPSVERHALDAVGSLDDGRHCHLVPADPIGEPARIGHFIERVDVQGSNVAALAGLREGVDREVVAIRVFDRHDLRGVECTIVVRPARIVRVETRRGGPRRRSNHQAQNDSDGSGAPGPRRWSERRAHACGDARPAPDGR
jgi:hypothetical protein